MAELLFEIGTEELPPGLIQSLTEQIKVNLITELNNKDIKVSEADTKTFNTPRRIAIHIANLPQKQELKKIEVKGPDKSKAFDESGRPTQAAIGFAKKYSLQPSNLEIKKVNDIEYVFAKTETGGEETINLLSKILPFSIKNTTGEKFMKWGNNNEKFARPIKWILALLDDKIIKFNYLDVKSSNYTYGHRFLSKASILIKSSKNYEKVLNENYVIVDQDKREKQIEEILSKSSRDIGYELIEDKELLKEVTNITEYPKSLTCKFNPNFLSLPDCVIQTVLRKHQKYFVLKDSDKRITNYFIVITNGINNVSVENGNEKVVKARLNDAQFFFMEDSKRPFTYEERIKDLSRITFQKGLGSMKDKVERIVKLSEYIFDNLTNPKTTKEDIKLTAQLCKLDLTTHMVFELPELQGQIGSEYAKTNNYNDSICSGIREHYNQVPSSIIGSIIGIADKLDNIYCLFAIGKVPSGSTDPFALRRQGQSVIDTMIDKNFNVNLEEILNTYKQDFASEKIKDAFKKNEGNFELVKTFLGERFMFHLSNKGHRLDIINAVHNIDQAKLSDIIDKVNKVTALEEYFNNNKDQFNLFLTAAKRLVRIVDSSPNGNLDTSKLKIEQEKKLLFNLDKVNKKEFKSYSEFLDELLSLTQPINSFFEKVLVNDPDPEIRKARQGLLKKGKLLFERICDFNEIHERN